MISARDLTLRRGPEALFERASFTVYRGDKVGVTGANGAGKSSLFAALRGELGADGGEIELPSGLRIAHVEQEISDTDRPAIEFVMDGDRELRSVEAAIAAAERRDAAMELAELHGTLQAIDGYRARARAAAVMHGLGFVAADHGRAVAEFSGGWRVRLAMARALGARADLLLLDEPTNHLDLDAIVWLEDWLRDHPGTVLMISHDREFLDAIVQRVLHIEGRAVRAYAGNYSAFERKRAEELAQQQGLADRQSRKVAQITAFVERFRAKASKSRQAQSRIKMLQRMERIVPAHVDAPFEFEFARPAKTPRPLLTVEGAACGHGGRALLAGVDLAVGPLDRIAILGPNGAGKSTLVKMLAGEAAPLAGRRDAAADLAVGYFAQQQMEQLQPEEHAFWHLRRFGGPHFAAGEELKVREHLAHFGFRGDRVFEAVKRFSGGERARLTLALVVANRPNLLLLDEPTNHLDIEMRHALNVALQSFEGGMIVVSHDRHLIKSVADTLWLVADGRVRVFDGDLDDYQQWLRQQAGRRTGEPVKRPRAAADPLGELRRELTRLEKRIAALAAERTSLESAAAHEADHGKLQRLIRTIATLEEQWLEVGGALEAAEERRSAAD